jgi:tetratricopeptide (TPR) repeat protein
MSAIARRLDPPGNDDDFDSLCCALFGAKWGVADIQRYGRNGYGQHGVDFSGSDDQGRLHGGQSKLRNRGRLTATEVREEVGKARKFRPPLADYIIATTAPNDPALQALAHDLTVQHRTEGLFPVTIYSWDELSELLNRSFTAIRDQFFGGIPGADMASVHTRFDAMGAQLDALQQTRAGESAEALDQEITAAAQYTLRGQPDVAVGMLGRLREHSWSQLSDRGRWRLLVNMGQAHTANQELRRAADLFMEAYPFQEGNPDAVAFTAIASLYRDDRPGAFAVAESLLRDHPENTRGIVVWIASAPDTMTVREMEERLPTALRANGDVAAALAQRGLDTGEWARAEAYAVVASEGAPGAITPKTYLALAILQQEIARGGGADASTLSARAVARGERVVAILSEVIEGFLRQGSPAEVAKAHLNRAVAQRFLGNQSAVEQDIQAAHVRAPGLPGAVKQYALLLRTRGDLDRAIAILMESVASAEDRELVLLLASLHFRRRRADDLGAAITLLREGLSEIATAGPEDRGDWIALLVQACCAAGRHAEAERLLRDLPLGVLVPETRLALAGEIQRQAGDVTAATASLEQAIAAHSPEALPDDRRRVALLAQALNRPAEALAQWRLIVTPTAVGDDTYDMLNCATRCQEDRFIMEFCRELREHGITDPQCFELELERLARYNASDEAIRLMEAYLSARADTPFATRIRVRLALALQRAGDADRATALLPAMPPVTAVDVYLGRAVVEVLRHGPTPADAVVYAYELWRRFPGHPEARQAVLFAPNVFGGRHPQLASSETVVPGMAVRYAEDDTGHERWWIIEDSPDPDIEREELAPEDPLAQMLIGKGVGDQLPRPGSTYVPRTVTIREIVPKYVRRWQYCIAQEEDVPHGDFNVQMIPFNSNLENAPDLGIFRTLLAQRAGSVQQIRELFRAQPMPLHILAELLNRPLFQTMHHVAASPDLVLNCSQGTLDELARGLAMIPDARVLVLDATALGTLLWLDGVTLLQEVGAECIISGGTLQELRRYVEQFAHPESIVAHLAMGEAGPVLFAADPGEREAVAERLRQALRVVETACTVRDGTALADIPAAERELLIECFGQASAEAIALARTPGHILWADDWLIALRARQAFGLEPIATPALLTWLGESGRIAVERFARTRLQLLIGGYTGVLINPLDFIVALRDANGDITRAPFAPALDTLASAMIPQGGAFLVAAHLLALVWQQEQLADQAELITARLGERLRARADGEGTIDALIGQAENLVGNRSDAVERIKELLTSPVREQGR